MSEVDVAALRDLLEKSVPAPWHARPDTNKTHIFEVTGWKVGDAFNPEEADAIVALVNAAPALLAEIEGLRERLARQDAVIEAARTFRDSVRWDLDGSAGDFVRRETELWNPVNEAIAALDALPPAEKP